MTILDYLRQLSSTILDYRSQLSSTILDYHRLSYLKLSHIHERFRDFSFTEQRKPTKYVDIRVFGNFVNMNIYMNLYIKILMNNYEYSNINLHIHIPMNIHNDNVHLVHPNIHDLLRGAVIIKNVPKLGKSPKGGGGVSVENQKVHNSKCRLF